MFVALGVEVEQIAHDLEHLGAGHLVLLAIDGEDLVLAQTSEARRKLEKGQSDGPGRLLEGRKGLVDVKAHVPCHGLKIGALFLPGQKLLNEFDHHAKRVTSTEIERKRFYQHTLEAEHSLATFLEDLNTWLTGETDYICCCAICIHLIIRSTLIARVADVPRRARDFLRLLLRILRLACKPEAGKSCFVKWKILPPIVQTELVPERASSGKGFGRAAKRISKS